MRLFISHLLCLLFAACALAAKPLGKEVCVASCYYTLLKIKYAASNATDQTACTHPQRIKSIFLCTRQHCQEDDLVPGLAWLGTNCKGSKKLVSLAKYHEATDNATAKYISSLPTVDSVDKAVVKGLALPSEKSWSLIYRSAFNYADVLIYHSNIRWIQYGYWGLVLLVGIGNYAISFIPRKRSTQSSGTAEGKKPSGITKLKAWMNGNVLMAPTFSYHHHQPLGWFTVPLRLQSLVILGYIILHIVLLSAHYSIIENSYYYKTITGQTLRIFSDRLGILMAASMPWIFVFGGRGNILAYVTGWSYRTFNLFHRWISIVLVVEGIIHGVSFSAYYVNEQGWDYYRDELANDETFLYGLIMVIATSLAVALALGPVRKHVYEFFKATHIILAAIFLAALYQHVKDQFSGMYMVWAYASIGIWCGDYVLRLLRLVLMNYKSFIGKETLALASFSEETGMIRLQVHPSMISAHQTPGTYYFLYFPSWRFWETHPFTLAGRSVDDISPCPSDQETSTESKTPSVGSAELTTNQGKPYLTFMIRPRDGMTRRLRDKLRGSSGQQRIRVLLEGPYGSPARLSHFDNILFIAGGSGITAVLPYLRRFCEEQSDSSSTPNIQLAWIAREKGFVQDVLANDLRKTEAAGLATTKLNMEFFLTPDKPTSISKTEEAGNGASDTRFKQGRPEISTLVDDFVSRRTGRTAVFVCGPAELADKTRLAVINHAKKGEDNVELFEEMFCW